MLLLSDRADGSQRLRRDLSILGHCATAPVTPPFGAPATGGIVITDVAIDSAERVGRLRAALRHYRSAGTGYMCLLRQENWHSTAQAFDLGADKTLPADAPRETLLAAVIDWQGPGESEVPAEVRGLRAQSLAAASALAVMMDAVGAGGTIDEESLDAGAHVVIDAVSLNGILPWLDSVSVYDRVTYQHSLLVAGIASAVAVKLSFPRVDRLLLTKAALLHDIGKACIPVEILNKPGPLTPMELAVMQSHAAIGHGQLVRQGGFEPEVLQIVRSHHELLDGSGYPDGLAGGAIPDHVRLATICDIYSALIERRPYKQPLDHAAAMGIMRGMKGQLDTALLRAFDLLMQP